MSGSLIDVINSWRKRLGFRQLIGILIVIFVFLISLLDSLQEI